MKSEASGNFGPDALVASFAMTNLKHAGHLEGAPGDAEKQAAPGRGGKMLAVEFAR